MEQQANHKRWLHCQASTPQNECSGNDARVTVSSVSVDIKFTLLANGLLLTLAAGMAWKQLGDW